MRTNDPAPLRPLLALAAALAGLLAGPAAAQFGGPNPVTVSAEVGPAEAGPGDRLVVAAILDHEPHYHSWPAKEQNALPPELDAFAIYTTVSVEVPEGVVVGPIQWPDPTPALVPNVTGEGPPTMEAPTFQGRAIAYVPLLVTDAATAGPAEITVRIGYQACDDQMCYMPQNETSELTVEILDAPAGAATPAGGDFAGFDASIFDDEAAWPTTEVEPPATDRGESPGPEGAETPQQAGQPQQEADAGQPAPAAARATFFGIPIGGGLVILAVLGFAGGLILNLTPCVLPVIPIKIMTLSQHAGQHRAKTLYLGVWMALGVIAFWVGVGLPVAFLNTVSDPSRVFGIWWLTVGIGVLIAVMSLGLMGMFSLQLPQKVYMLNPKADNAWGSFLFGVMTAVLGLPCFGFVAGALVPAALTQGEAFVIVLFTSMGVGMAAPYFVLSAFPGLIDRLPRTGPASELVKQVMGLLLLAAAAYFIGSGLIALVSAKPYLAKQLHIWVAGLLGVAAGLWLLWRTFRITKSIPTRAVFAVLSLAIAAGGLWVAMAFTKDAREDYLERQRLIAEAEAAGGGGAILTTVWNDYSPALVERALDEGKTVVMDFTAEWCINCKFLKKTVLNVDPVRTQLLADDVVMVKVDLTGSNPEGEEALAALDRTGIPTLAIYGPGLSTPWVSSAYTSEQVLLQLERARERSPVARAEPGG